jgi:flagellar biosynthetic protein FliP
MKALLRMLGMALALGLALPSLSAQEAAEPPPPPAATAGGGVTAGGPMELNIRLNGQRDEADVGVALQLVIVMTLLTLAPSLVILMTSFTRLVIVLGFTRTALGVPSAPANQVIIGLSLFLTLFIMGPVFDEIYNESLGPHLADEITAKEALDRATGPIRQFMLRQTRTSDLEFFLQLGRFPPTRVQDLPMRVVIPAFITSELQTAFKMGFLIFLPFLVIDFIVSAVLMSLGMMMMPPAVVSLPFKLLLFVLVDGWYLIVSGLVESFN